jgi:hypothetical protein
MSVGKVKMSWSHVWIGKAHGFQGEVAVLDRCQSEQADICEPPDNNLANSDFWQRQMKSPIGIKKDVSLLFNLILIIRHGNIESKKIPMLSHSVKCKQ